MTLLHTWSYTDCSSQSPQTALNRRRRSSVAVVRISSRVDLCNMADIDRDTPGLNSDDMGLGKTLTMIALILATKNDVSNDYSKSTLVGTRIYLLCFLDCNSRSRVSHSVVPLSIMSNWEKQLKDHCTPGSISSCVYYGAGRSMTAADLQRHDVVITTYQTVANEVESTSTNVGVGASQKTKKRKVESSLFDVRWKVSVVL